jgi:hypothetical protein
MPGNTGGSSHVTADKEAAPRPVPHWAAGGYSLVRRSGSARRTYGPANSLRLPQYGSA